MVGTAWFRSPTNSSSAGPIDQCAVERNSGPELFFLIVQCRLNVSGVFRRFDDNTFLL